MEENNVPVNTQNQDTIDVSEPSQPPKKPEFQAPPKKKSSKKKVFLTLLLIFLVVVLGLAGWKWYGQIREYQDKQAAADQQIAELQSQIDGLKKTSEDSVNEEAASSQVLTVKEWGVVFPVDSKYSNLTYTIENSSGSEENVAITAASVTTTAECGGKLAVGTISRDKQPKSIDGSPITDFEGYKKVGDYWYWYRTPQSLCDPTTASSAEAYTTQLKSAVANTKAVGEE